MGLFDMPEMNVTEFEKEPMRAFEIAKAENDAVYVFKDDGEAVVILTGDQLDQLFDEIYTLNEYISLLTTKLEIADEEKEETPSWDLVRRNEKELKKKIRKYKRDNLN